MTSYASPLASWASGGRGGTSGSTEDWTSDFGGADLTYRSALPLASLRERSEQDIYRIPDVDAKAGERWLYPFPPLLPLLLRPREASLREGEVQWAYDDHANSLNFLSGSGPSVVLRLEKPGTR